MKSAHQHTHVTHRRRTLVSACLLVPARSDNRLAGGQPENMMPHPRPPRASRPDTGKQATSALSRHIDRNGPGVAPQSRLALHRSGERDAALDPQRLDEEAAKETPATVVFTDRQRRTRRASGVQTPTDAQRAAYRAADGG
jgi:hypothetical protein